MVQSAAKTVDGYLEELPAERRAEVAKVLGVLRKNMPRGYQEVMFGPPGHAYVYLIYGMHWCMNVVTQPEGKASAVLLRALEPVRNVEGRTQGPGLLCKAMGIDGRYHGQDLLSDTLFVREPDAPEPHAIRIVKRPRIGVDYAGHHWARRLLRFYIRGNPFISRP